MPQVSGGGQRNAPVKSGAPGASCSIAFSDADETAVWRIDVDIDTPNGRFRLGSIQTVPPVGAPPAARIVAIGYCPGAQRWYATATKALGRTTEDGDLDLQTSDCCGAFGDAGIVPVLPFARSLDIIQFDSGAASTAVVIATVPVRLLELNATSQFGGVATNVQLYDLTTQPGEGAVAQLLPIPLPAGDTVTINPNVGDRPHSKGMFFRNGLVAVSSLTYATKTAVGAQPLWWNAILRQGA